MTDTNPFRYDGRLDHLPYHPRTTPAGECVQCGQKPVDDAEPTGEGCIECGMPVGMTQRELERVLYLQHQADYEWEKDHGDHR